MTWWRKVKDRPYNPRRDDGFLLWLGGKRKRLRGWVRPDKRKGFEA